MRVQAGSTGQADIRVGAVLEEVHVADRDVHVYRNLAVGAVIGVACVRF